MEFQDIIDTEEQRIQAVLEEMRSALAAEKEDRHRMNQEIAELKQQKLEANGWREKQEIDERIAVCRERYRLRSYQDSMALTNPYFGVLGLDDDDLGTLSYCLGKRSFFGRRGQVLVIDWREAPISRLYYEYEAGEIYDEDIRDRERSGEVTCKRKVDTGGGELRTIAEKDVLLVRNGDGQWHRADDAGGAVSRKEDAGDHRLPEITALISADQFRAITQTASRTFLLQGGAGSGKTTVGLHRIAYLVYHEPERFGPGRILVVMFNRSLQRYISRVLPELGVPGGVITETYHRWAGSLFRAAGLSVTYTADPVPPPVLQFKKSPAILALIDCYLDNLLEKSRRWFLSQLQQHGDPDQGKIAALCNGAGQFDAFFQMLYSHPFFLSGPQPEFRQRLRMRILQRFGDHRADLYAALSDGDLLDELLRVRHFKANPGLIRSLKGWQERLAMKGQTDFADTGILLWLMQRKGIGAVLPDYAHIMVDEAQDLSAVELATLVLAADDAQSVTICGDMAQKIRGEFSFDGPDGFSGFVRDLQKRVGNRNISAETLMVGYRATRPIMELAWHVLGEKPSMSVPRDGEPVGIIRTDRHEETMKKAASLLKDYVARRPNALVGVVCRFKADADRAFADLKQSGVPCLRRHERNDFSFQPGVIVTNAHQIKGLEFSAILVLNPSCQQYREDRESQMLLHVVITRAAEQLWIVGHQIMAYGLEKWGTQDPDVPAPLA